MPNKAPVVKIKAQPGQSCFQVDADKENIITMPSQIIYALWSVGCAMAGGEIPFEVRTSFVGDGAEVEVKCYTESGSKVGSLKTRIFGNRLNGLIPIPPKLDDSEPVWFESRLPKHGIKAESNLIPVIPLIIVQSMQWGSKDARRGDIVKLTARFDQLPDEIEAMVVIKEYSEQGYHDPIVKIPTVIKNKRMELQWEYDYYDDTGKIATEEELKKYGKSYHLPKYFFELHIYGQKIGLNQESGFLTFKDTITIKLLDADGKGSADAEYTLYLPDGKQEKGRTDKDGYAIMKDVSPGPWRVEVTG